MCTSCKGCPHKGLQYTSSEACVSSLKSVYASTGVLGRVSKSMKDKLIQAFPEKTSLYVIKSLWHKCKSGECKIRVFIV